METLKRIAILGSTGSIGQQALDVIQKYPEQLQVEVLTANTNADLLIKQALQFKPNAVVIADPTQHQIVKDALLEHDIKVYTHASSIEQIVQMESVDVVLAAMVGYSGLKPVISAIKSGKPIALANKETLVVAGELVTRLAKEMGVNLYPVDSEHSAIFQCLVGEFHNNIEKVVLTASGGPFRGKKRGDIENVSVKDALKHPNWSMGAKITIDSATLMNKGLEVIEAKWLFGLKPEQIEVIVHPQSIIHSIVQFEDGSMKAQMGLPDMKLPILYALTYPERYKTEFPRFDFMQYPQLTFEKPDTEVFLGLTLAYEAMHKGGNMACILNAANEVAVDLFLKETIKFLQIYDIIEKTMQKASYISSPTLEDYVQSDLEARKLAQDFVIKNKSV